MPARLGALGASMRTRSPAFGWSSTPRSWHLFGDPNVGVKELEAAEAAGGPDPEVRVADDRRLLDRAEKATVAGLAAVVAHHEDAVAAHGDRSVHDRLRTGGEVRLVDGFVVDVELAVAGGDRLAAHRD